MISLSHLSSQFWSVIPKTEMLLYSGKLGRTFPCRCLVKTKQIEDYLLSPKLSLLKGYFGWRHSRNFLSLARKLETERKTNGGSVFGGRNACSTLITSFSTVP